MSKKVITFIMAGGKGERLLPLTKDRTKPAVPFGGIYRIIDFTLSNCVNSGLKKVYVLTQYKSASLQRHIRMGWNIMPAELGEFVELLPAQQRVGESWYLGTADAIYQNINVIEGEQPDEVVILAGDHIYKMNYYNMINYHREHNADLTVGIVEIPADIAGQFGIIDVDASGRVKGFREKPSKAEVGDKKVFASMGIYIFNARVLEEVLREDADRHSQHDFGRDIIPLMLNKGLSVFAYNFRDENKREAQYWRDIGTIDAYYDANMDLVEVSPLFNLYDKEWPVRTYQEQCPPVKTVFSGEEDKKRVGVVLDSLVSSGCVISGGRVQHSVLSPNVRINSYSEVYDSILMEGVDVGRYAKIKRAIIDKDARIAPNSVIGYDIKEDMKRFTVTDSGIVVVAKGMEIK
ncbi:MAG: glucose-1-phosphate adenylyltransferase [Candidatus Omnitrophica bacterium]|nr:glucose-1-phosphate adenylyltransferase [Candidatus Omnitrophota bacterium]